MKKPVLLLFSLLLSFLVFAQNQDIISYYDDPGRHERNRNVDVTLMKLEVSFEPTAGKVFGKVSHTFRCLQNNIDSIFLDGPGIFIRSAMLDGKPVKTDSIASGIVVRTGLSEVYNSSHVLVLEYTATPEKGIYFIGWKQPIAEDPVHQTRRQIWTQGQGIDNRHWIPMIDDRGDKFITEVLVSFDKTYNVLSNGDLLEEKENKDGTKTWHYKINHQHAGYLLMLAIDKYAIKRTKTKRGTPINFWYYPQHPERLESSSLYSERIIEFLEDEIGYAYPWGSYSQVMVQDFMYGAMENTSATVFGDFFWVDPRAFLDRNYIGVNAHEATHQWFGDLITARNDADHWLQESFATFYPGLFMGNLYGADEMYWSFRGSMNGALAAGEKNSLPVHNSEAGSGRHYPKGASVLYMLQHIMGRDNFRRGVQLYLNRFGFSGVETRDFQIAMADACGMNLDWFFDQWIYRGGEPQIKVSTQKINAAVEFTVEQTKQKDPTVGVFKLPVDIAVHFTDGTIERKTVTVDKAFQKIYIPNPANKTVAFALFDEGGFILKKLEFEKTYEELRSQLINAKFILDRYDALLALAKYPLAKKRDLLLESYRIESYKNFKAEIIKQLAADPLGNAEFLIDAYNSAQVEIRKAVVNNTAVNESTSPIFEKALEDSSYAVIETALNKIWESPIFDARKAEMLEKIKMLDGFTMGLKIKYYELGCDIYPDLKTVFITFLEDFCSEKYEFRTRVNAMQALQRLNTLNEPIVHNLFNGILSFNGRLAGPSKDVLAYFKQQTAYLRLMKRALDSDRYLPKEKQKIKTALDL
jgi:aminopeptidase N